MMRSQASRRASLLGWRPWLAALFLMSANGQASQEKSAQPFSLDQIATQFPSQGFENEIAFWTRIFTFYSQRQIVFHDRGDLRIIYQTADMGRGIRDADGPESGQVAIVNTRFVERFLAEVDPLGQRIRMGGATEEALYGGPVWREIVGVVADIHHDDLAGRPSAEIFTPFAQRPSARVSLVARSHGQASSIVPSIRSALLEVVPDELGIPRDFRPRWG